MMIGAVALTAVGCQSTVISSSWRNESFRKENMGKVFIVSHLKDEVLRRKSEDAFAQKLLSHGVSSLQSYKFFEQEKDTEKTQVTRRIKQEGCSHVLVVKLLDEKTVTFDNRPACFTVDDWNARGWYPYYNDACTKPYLIELDILRMETALFEAETDKLLWATQTHTELTSKPTDKDIEEWVNLIINSMFSN